MEQTTDQDVLRRKLNRAATRVPGDDPPALQVLRRAVARAGRDTLGLRIDVTDGIFKRFRVDALGASLPEDHLILTLAREGGLSGAVALGPGLVRALIQQQTMGLVPESAAQEPRGFTDTDAALCVPLIQAVAERSGAAADGEQDLAGLSGHGVGGRLRDSQTLIVALDDLEYDVAELQLDLAGGAITTGLVAILPIAERGGEEAANARAQTQRATLGHVAFNAAVRLNAVLCRVNLAYSDLAKLRPGDCLPLPAYRLDRTELLTMSGAQIGVGRLGKVDGLRAIWVNETTPAEIDFADGDGMQRLGSDLPPVPIDASLELAESEDYALDHLDQDEAIKRISELAGLEDGEPALDLG